MMAETNIKIYENNKLLYDCTLCKNSEGKVGWYDFVSGKFYENHELKTYKQEYHELEYMESHANQWIDTKVFTKGF